MDWVLTAIGVAIIVEVLVDIFHTLAYPGAQGHLSRTLLRSIWCLTRHSRFSGPLAMLAVIGIWGVLAVLGWALVYWPHLPDGFRSTGSGAGDGQAFLDAIYISMVTISTLGFGDVFPTSDWLRIVNPLQALFGFALLTVAVSWILQVYPALARRKAFAIRLTLLRDADSLRAITTLDAPSASRLLDEMTAGLVSVRVDISEFPETYYFREDDRPTSLAANLGYLAELASAALASEHPAVQHSADVLIRSVDDFAGMIDAKFLRTRATTSDVLTAYASEHRHTQEQPPR
jgi:hypothetical protein